MLFAPPRSNSWSCPSFLPYLLALLVKLPEFIQAAVVPNYWCSTNSARFARWSAPN